MKMTVLSSVIGDGKTQATAFRPACVDVFRVYGFSVGQLANGLMMVDYTDLADPDAARIAADMRFPVLSCPDMPGRERPAACRALLAQHGVAVGAGDLVDEVRKKRK